MIIVTTTDFKTDEDSELASKATKIAIDSFLKRPGLDDKAMRAVADFANNGVFMENGGQEDKNEEKPLCAMAGLFSIDGHARWIACGGAMVFHFEDGKLARHSAAKETPPLGVGPRYFLELEDTFELTAEKNAFLVCSRELALQTTPEMLEKTLENSKTPEEWVKNILAEVDTKRQFCLNVLFLPERKKLFGKARKPGKRPERPERPERRGGLPFGRGARMPEGGKRP